MKILKILRNSFNHTQKKLAKKLSLETNTIALYEAGKANPSFKILKKLIELYQVSYDYFLLDDNCLFPKNLKLLRLAKKLDDLSKSDARNTIESNAKSLLGKKINNKILLRIDLIDLELSTKFNSNLKLIRQYKKLSQEQLGNLINISRSLLSKYEQKNFPSIEKLIDLSKALDVSIHILTTGEKLSFIFQDGIFGQTMLYADHFLSLEHQKTLITLMEAILKTQPTQS